MKKLVFDVGASAIKYALMDDTACIDEKGKVETPKDTLENFIQELKKIYLMYEDRIDGIALSVPGTVDANTGQIYAPGGILYNENVNLVKELHSFTKLPIAIENDGKSAALAESWKGNLSDCEDGIVIVLGSGIGGGIIKDGRVWKGHHLFAGEFSYIMLGDGTTMENVWALKGSTTALLMEVAKRKQVDMASLDGYRVFDMIHQKDKDACDALLTVAKHLAKGIFDLQCILDPQRVVIGGGISQQPILIETIQNEVDKIYKSLPFEIPQPEIMACKYFNDSNLIGALYNFLIQHGGVENETI